MNLTFFSFLDPKTFEKKRGEKDERVVLKSFIIILREDRYIELIDCLIENEKRFVKRDVLYYGRLCMYCVTLRV